MGRPTAWAWIIAGVIGAWAALGWAHSQRLYHGPTTPTLVDAGPADAVGPRLLVRHRMERGGALSADPTRVTVAQTGQAIATHAHATPLVTSGLHTRVVVVVDTGALLAPGVVPDARYRLRDLGNALRQNFAPGERFTVAVPDPGGSWRLLPDTDSATAAADFIRAAGAPGSGVAPSLLPAPVPGLIAATDGEVPAMLLVTTGSAVPDTARLRAWVEAARTARVALWVLAAGAFDETNAPPPAGAGGSGDAAAGSDGSGVVGLASPDSRQPGAFATDPIVRALHRHSVRATDEVLPAWAPLCREVAATGGRCVASGQRQGAFAIAAQRAVGEAQAVFVLPVSCVEPAPEPLVLVVETETGRDEREVASPERLRCATWQQARAGSGDPAEVDGPGAAHHGGRAAERPGWAVGVAAAALLLAGLFATWVVRRRRR